MAEWLGYSDSVNRVLQALGELRIKGTCPTLLCLPDILVLRDEHLTPLKGKSRRKKRSVDEESRVLEAPPSYLLDGHACISALTTAYLSTSLASEYNVVLAVKAGDYGQRLLRDIRWEFQKRGSEPFHSLIVKGTDREIKTPFDTGDKVKRTITDAEDANQLSWPDLDSLNFLPWLEPGRYGLVCGDAESYLVGHDHEDRMQALVKNAAITVIDTLAWKDKEDQNRRIWATVRSLAAEDSPIFVSVSDGDARLLALAAGLVVDADAGLDTICQALASSLESGFLVLHGKDGNKILSCKDSRICCSVPICDIQVVAANGAGDTFNGGLALAALAVFCGKSIESASDDLLRDVLAFATVVVSLRLKNGRYATRSDVLIEPKHLQPKSADTSVTIPPIICDSPPLTLLDGTGDHNSWGQWLAHAHTPFWNRVPKLALIDLDHTLCDSEKWRRTSALAGFRALGISGEPQDHEKLYDDIYKDHELWEEVLGVNVRYTWNTPKLFELALTLDEVTSSDYDTLRMTPMLVGIELNRVRNINRGTGKRVEAAVRAFNDSPAFFYPDSIAGLYQLRDVLGFKLLMVTEGDFDTQCWKLQALGLRGMFSTDTDTVHTEDAFASVEQVKRAFQGAIFDAIVNHKHKDREYFEAALEICMDHQRSLKASWRSAALAKILKKNKDESAGKWHGAFVCTFGDRIETDVIPYREIRAKRLTGSERGGLYIGRLKRGHYKTEESPDTPPDVTVDSLPEFVSNLARPGFWDKEPTIRGIEALGHTKLKRDERLLLKAVMKLDPNVSNLVETLLRYESNSG